MAIQTVNLGTYANSSTGDDLRTAFEKVNANFAFLDLTSAVTADNIGAGARVFKEKIGDNLQLRSVVAGTGITVVENADNITVTSIIDITRDTAPQLGGNLVLGGFDVTGTGNVNITGSMTSTGDVAVNGGDLTTTASTFNLINTTATTVNLAAAANFLNIGKTTGLTTVVGELQVNDDVVITNNGRLKTTNSSAYVFNETANYVFVGQSAVRVDLGSVNGIVGLGHDGEVANDFTVSGTIYGNFDATQGTVDLLTVVNTLYANDISLSGNLSGNLVGNVTGNTTGTHTGAVVGNVTSTGASSFNTISAIGVITGATVGNVIPFYYANQSAFPNPATYHGAIAHSHADGKMYFAHSGSWAALANASDAYVLPTATTSVLGGVKIDGNTITLNGSNQLVATYTLPTATTSVLGGVIIPLVATSGITNTSGTIGLAVASSSQLGGVKIDGTTITLNGSNQLVATTYTLPTATTSVLGGVRVDGTTITISGGIISSSGGGGGGGSLDFGTFASPAGFTLDLGSF